ncbi:MAG: YebC/PmpR family DNA-binding transcriptional regulator, partial [Candidatus Pacebacteria bacterium]|nr:YebC/PmpR family DNA-binding transcriptional regulator [Candidatus Paceibacterota bacterium]
HNKWSKIKHKKAATDAARSKVFSKLNRLITVEAKKCGSDVSSPGLKTAIEKAKKANMPNDTIDRAVKKAASDNGADVSPVRYEAYGPGGVAVVIEGLTDNNNRTAAEIRHILSKNNSQLAAEGSALWAFTNTEGEWQANNTVPLSDQDADKLSKLVDELEENEDVQGVFTNAE